MRNSLNVTFSHSQKSHYARTRSNSFLNFDITHKISSFQLLSYLHFLYFFLDFESITHSSLVCWKLVSFVLFYRSHKKSTTAVTNRIRSIITTILIQFCFANEAKIHFCFWSNLTWIQLTCVDYTRLEFICNSTGSCIHS